MFNSSYKRNYPQPNSNYFASASRSFHYFPQKVQNDYKMSGINNIQTQNTNNYLSRASISSFPINNNYFSQSTLFNDQERITRPYYSDLTNQLLERDSYNQFLKKNKMSQNIQSSQIYSPSFYQNSVFVPSVQSRQAELQMELYKQKVLRECLNQLPSEKKFERRSESRPRTDSLQNDPKLILRQENGFNCYFVDNSVKYRKSVPHMRVVQHNIQPVYVPQNVSHQKVDMNQNYYQNTRNYNFSMPQQQAIQIINQQEPRQERIQLDRFKEFTQTRTLHEHSGHFQASQIASTRNSSINQPNNQNLEDQMVKKQYNKIQIGCNRSVSPGITCYRTEETPQQSNFVTKVSQRTIFGEKEQQFQPLQNSHVINLSQNQSNMSPNNRLSKIPETKITFSQSQFVESTPKKNWISTVQHVSTNESIINSEIFEENGSFCDRSPMKKSILKRSGQNSAKKRVFIDENQNQLKEFYRNSPKRNTSNSPVCSKQACQQFDDGNQYGQSVSVVNKNQAPFGLIQINGPVRSDSNQERVVRYERRIQN